MPTWSGKRLETDMGWSGEGPFFYTSMPEPDLSAELSRISHPETQAFASDSDDRKGALRVDSVTMQPCLDENERSQDRLFVKAVQGVGTLVAVLDGHGGHEAVDLSVSTLPDILSSAISSCPKTTSSISAALRQSILAVDQQIIDGITSLFPEGVESLSDKEVDEIASKNHDKLLLGMRGTTALIAFVDEKREGLWVAGVGDCLAVLGTQNEDGEWECEVLTKSHNGVVPAEAERIRQEHPNEPEALTRGRVLGAIAVTRAIGDMVFKLPAIITSRVFLSPSAPPFRTHTPVREVVLPRILTPPYLSAEPDMAHVSLSQTPAKKRVLIMCSDGLPSVATQMNEKLWRKPGMAEGEKEAELGRLEKKAAEGWVQSVGATLSSSPSEEGKENSESNLALALLRSVLSSQDGMGGGEGTKEEGEKLLSRWMTVEMAERWMDDITIQVVTL